MISKLKEFNLKKIDWQSDTTLKVLICLAFSFFMFLLHYPLGYVGDDVIMGPGVDQYTLWSNFVWHWESNGRIITDVFANIWYRFPSMMWWKVFDTGVFLVIALLFARIFTKNTWKDVGICCVLTLLFPFIYMESAGYIATTGNYLYPLFCVLLITLHLTYVREGRKVSKWVYVSTVLSLIYATNHDQTGIALVAGLLMYFIYLKVTKADQRLTKNTGIIFGSATTLYILNFFIPGHINRMQDTEAMLQWFPEYADWTLLDKIYRGYSTTVANLFFNNVKLFLLFTFLLMLLALKQKCNWVKLIGFLPFGLTLLDDFAYSARFIYYYPYCYQMPDLFPIQANPLPFILTVIALVSIFVTIWKCDISLDNKLLLTMLLVLAAGTREMMGLSFTIFASSFRTFTFFLFAIIACCIVILRIFEEDTEKKPFWYMGIGAMLALLLI